MQELHTGAYLGYEERRRLPDKHGLRQLWDFPSVNETVFYESHPTPTSMVHMTSLWDAGTRFVVGT